jgi:hypothetical protein
MGGTGHRRRDARRARREVGPALEGAWEVHDCFSITEIINEDKFCGHPVGASGVRMINNVVEQQLLGRAGRMQVPGPRTGLADTLGGPCAVSCVALLGQP